MSITLYFDLQKAQRDKSKLVYVQRTVTKNGKTFQQGFWVQPSQVKSSDTVLQGQNVLSQYQQSKANSQTNTVVGNFDKSKYTILYTTDSKQKAMQYAKDNGISWNEHSNPAINWMRCQMAVNKALGGSVVIGTSNSNQSSLDTSNLSSGFNSMNKKDKIVELLKYNSRDSLINFARAKGITWKENDNAGINWMRCSMAIQNYLETNSLTSASNSDSKPDTKVPEPDTISIPANATERQKSMISLINSISKKEDFDLYGAVGMIAEDDAAKEFMEKTLRPRYDSWKSGHQPSAGRSGPVYDGFKEFGKAVASELGNANFIKGLSGRVLQKTFSSMARNLSLASVLYPREVMISNSLPGQPDKVINDKTSARNLLDFANLSQRLNDDFTTRDTQSATEWNYNDWDSKKYNSKVSLGFVKALEHIKKNQPELAKECDRMIKCYSELLSMCDKNPKILETVLSTQTYTNYHSKLERQVQTAKAEMVLSEIFKEQGLTPSEIRYTLNQYTGYGNSDPNYITVYDDKNTQKLDTSGNPIRIDVSDFLNRTKNVDFKNLIPKDIKDNISYWSSENSIREAVTGNEPTSWGVINASKIMTEKNWCDIQRKMLELYNMDLKVSNRTFDKNSNDSDEWVASKRSDNFKRVVNDSEDTDAVLANLYFIEAVSKTAERAERSVPNYTVSSATNDYGANFDKHFTYKERVHIYQNQEIESIRKSLETQMDKMPTISKQWIQDAKTYAEKNGDDTYTDSYWDKPSTSLQKKHAKAYSCDLESKASILQHNNTPTGDLFMMQVGYLAEFAPMAHTTRFNTTEKVKANIKKKLDWKDFELPKAEPQTQQNFGSELRKQREELLKKVHCSLKTCDSVQYDAIQTQIKHSWDLGQRNASGQRLYGHISAVFKNAYRVNNSLQEERMLENAQKLNETPQQFFHGTNHSGATGIVGVDGRFRAPKSSADAAKSGLKYAGGMLGSGVYLAKMAGKSAGYFGTWGAGYDNEGCMLVCKAVLGNTYVSTGYNSSAPSNYDTVSMQAGTNTGRTVLRADEWCVRNPDFVFPEFIVDMATKRR